MASSVVRKARSGNGVFDVILRDGTMACDLAIMDALERAGCFVIGNPQAFRYRWPGKQKFARPTPRMVVVLGEDGEAALVYTREKFMSQFKLCEGTQ